MSQDHGCDAKEYSKVGDMREKGLMKKSRELK